PDPNFGSGAVKITGAHDFNDYGVASRNNIPMYRLMDTRAQMWADGAPYADCAARAQEIAEGAAFTPEEIDTLNLIPDHLRGLDRFEARKRVVEEITAEGLAVMVAASSSGIARGSQEAGGPRVEPEDDGGLVPYVEAKPIMQPFGDRSKVVIEPMLTDQWFVDTAKIVGPALDAVRSGEVTILPESDRKVYFHWLENIEPWCISRQLWWGHQIPVWYGFDLSAPDFHDDEGDGTLDLVEMLRLLNEGHLGPLMECGADVAGVTDAFHERLAGLPVPLASMQVVEVESRDAALHRLASALADYTATQDPTHLVYPVWRDPDVLDTWFSSGLWPIGTLGWPENTQELQKYF
ncbi:MAG: class I tRNA ligase family protein, partial [Roseovarius sp.]|nr:class I tRNA ligase family protein [Roseovarius sp.]